MYSLSNKSGWLLLFWSIFISSVHAEHPGFQLRLDCGQVITGGFRYQTVFSDDDETSITIHNIEDGTVETILKVEKPFEKVQLSPSCRWFSFRKFDHKINKSTVRIVSRSGKDERVLTDVRYYAWGIDVAEGDCIAYIVGEKSDSEEFQSKGTWLLNVDSGEERQIHPRGHELAWAVFDRSFYIGDWQADNNSPVKEHRYDMEAKSLEDTSYQGIDFSPDGTYYHTRTYGETPLLMYLRKTNEDVSSRYVGLLDVSFNGDPYFWLNNTMLVFHSERRRNKGNRIADFGRSVVWEVQEEVIGFADKDEKFLLTFANGKVVTRKFEDVAKLIYPVPVDEKQSTPPPSDGQVE